MKYIYNGLLGYAAQNRDAIFEASIFLYAIVVERVAKTVSIMYNKSAGPEPAK